MTNQQHLSHQALDTAGTLTRNGCQILAATAINGMPWIKAAMPKRLSPEARIRLLTAAWSAPAIVEWRTK